MCLSSSIFASSSAIGCSKSRNATAIGATLPIGPGGLARLRARPGIRKALGAARRAAGAREAQLDAIAADELFERSSSSRAGRTLHSAPRVSAQLALGRAIFDRDRAGTGAKARQDLRELIERRRRLRRRPA